MTFNYIVGEVLDRLNLSSASAQARVGRTVNERYAELRTSLGLQPVAQDTVTSLSIIGDRKMTFALDKVQRVYINTTPAAPFVLVEITMMEMRERIQITEPPQSYAILHMGPGSVDIYLDCTPTSIFTLTADGLVPATTLSGSQVPNFPEDFHNCLIYAGMEVEYQKMGKEEDAQMMGQKYEKRKAELVYFMAKSAMLGIYQNKQARGSFIPTFPL